MAEYEDLRGLYNDSDMLNKVTVAVAVSVYAESIISGARTPAQNKWIDAVVSNPSKEAKKVWVLVIAANKDVSIAAIKSASKEIIQTKVDLICPVLIDALAGV